MALRKTVRILKMPASLNEQVSTPMAPSLTEAQIQSFYCSLSLMREFCEEAEANSCPGFGKIYEEYTHERVDLDLEARRVLQILNKRIQRMIKNKKIKKNWSNEDTKVLVWLFSHYALKQNLTSVEETTPEHWQKISALLPGTTPKSCMFKILSQRNVRLCDRKWSPNESFILSQIVDANPNQNWRAISQELYQKNKENPRIFRSPKQCKEHWICFLNPINHKGPWSLQEDQKLLRIIVQNNGLRKWAHISRVFKGRTENALKNRYLLLIQRLKKESDEPNEVKIIENYLSTINEKNQCKKQEQGHFQIDKGSPFKKLTHQLIEDADEVLKEEIVSEHQQQEIPHCENIQYSFLYPQGFFLWLCKNDFS